jgi:hypothetical protein
MFSISYTRPRERTYTSGEVARQLVASGDLARKGNPGLVVRTFLRREGWYRDGVLRLTAAQVRKVADDFRAAQVTA